MEVSGSAQIIPDPGGQKASGKGLLQYKYLNEAKI